MTISQKNESNKSTVFLTRDLFFEFPLRINKPDNIRENYSTSEFTFHTPRVERENPYQCQRIHRDRINKGSISLSVALSIKQNQRDVCLVFQKTK